LTLQLFALLALSAVCGVSVSALYIVWPRRMTAEEWVLHRRALSLPAEERRASTGLRLSLGPLPARLQRYRRLLALTRPNLELLRLAGGREPASERDLAYSLARLAGYGAAVGLALDLIFWFASGRSGAWAAFAFVGLVAGAAIAPVLWLLSLRQRAARLRSAIDRRLPRLLTAARVLLESGATTPEGAVNEAVAIHTDPAADLLREALRLKEVQRLDLEVALDDVASRYEVASLERLADGFRVGSRYGTRMAQLLAEHARQLRQRQHQEYRERVTRAPVLMTVPALLFFVLPLLVLIMYLVFTPLLHTLTQL
jgi:Flp pilus assembly protein TadB